MMIADTDLACLETHCRCDFKRTSNQVDHLTGYSILQGGSAVSTSNLVGSSYPHITFICSSYLFVDSSPCWPVFII